MIVSIHQPHFLPWLGYINKISHCDCFVWLDTVQYRKNYFQNRCRIRSPDGREQWLTVPVRGGSTMPISEITTADERWRPKVVKTVGQAYGKTEFFERYWPAIEAGMERGERSLAEINCETMTPIMNAVGLGDVDVVKASELRIDVEDPTERLVALCREVGATQYIAGRGGKSYLDVERFRNLGIDVVWQEFEAERTAYAVDGQEVVGLSVIDALFRFGGERTLEIARSGWAPLA